jgi:hypothetical protein
MISYSIALLPYSANELADDQLITISRYLIANACITVTKLEWLDIWHKEGWRPVDVYVVSNEKIFSEGDLVWTKAFGILNYSKGMPIHSIKKVILQPTSLKKISANRLSSLLDMGDTLSVAELRKIKLVSQ